MTYEVYALKYAHHARRASENFIGGDPHDGPMPLDYFVWLIRGEGREVVVDIGFSAAMARKRGRDHLRCPADALRLLDVDPARVKDVVITHLHYDHVGNFERFPAATLHLQELEMRYATGRYMCSECFRGAFEAEDVVGVVRRVYDGRDKMSKSLGNYVGIAEPPQEMFGKLMSISDELMWRYIELLSFEPPATVARWKNEHPRDVKVAFAKEIVARFHSPAAARAAEAEFEQRFRHGVLPQDMPEITLQSPAGGLPIAQLLKLAQLAASASEAVRAIEQGGVRIDGERVTDRNLRLAAGKTLTVQVGKRKFARVRLA